MNPDSAGVSAPKLKQRIKEATREAILDAAEQVFVLHGLEGGRMEQVAAAAGVSVGTLYNYFADRKALIRSLLDARKSEMLRRVDDALLAAPPDAIGRLRVLALTSLEHFEAHRPFIALIVQEGAAAECAPAGGLQPTTTMRGLQERARAALAQTRDEKPAAELDLLAHLFVGLLRAAILYGLTERTSLEPAATTERIVACFVHGSGVA